jgi:hypothetical protein
MKIMTRYINRINTPVPPLSLSQALGDYLNAEGFTQVQYKGNLVWKKGSGVLTAPQYVILTYGEQEIILEAFIKFAALPGVYVGELGTTGFVGAIPKGMLKTRIEAIERYIYSLWQQPTTPPIPEPQPQQVQPPQSSVDSQQPTPAPVQQTTHE